MTFIIKIRGALDRPIAAEYMCPVHGRFTVTISRDENGDAPSEVFCERPAIGTPTLVCLGRSPYVISAPLVGVRRVEVVRGGWEKPARKTFLDTRDLGEGQDIDEWRAGREAIRDEERRKGLKELIDG